MDDLVGTSFLVQVVHILCHYRHVVVLLQGCDEAMALVGLGAIELLAKPVVERGDEVGVSIPRLMGGNFLHGHVLPKAVVATERLESTLHRHSCAGEKNDFLHSKNI